MVFDAKMWSFWFSAISRNYFILWKIKGKPVLEIASRKIVYVVLYGACVLFRTIQEKIAALCWPFS